MSYDNMIDEHILSILTAQDIQEQSEIQHELEKRGYHMPQATLSRRLKKLKIAKIAGIYKPTTANASALPTILNIQISDYGLIVLHTQPSYAHSLAYFLDQKYVAFYPSKIDELGIIGTIAGDDTVLLITKGKSFLPKILERLQQDFPYLTIPTLN